MYRKPSRMVCLMVVCSLFCWTIQIGSVNGQAAVEVKVPEAVPVTFESVDQVELKGTFFPSAKDPKKSPAVIFLHAIGGANHSKQPGWESLAQALQKEGCAVLSFDFRGHGESNRMGPGFWEVRKAPPNDKVAEGTNRQLVKGYNPNKVRTTISVKDYTSTYYPCLLNDISAAKTFLDGKNDAEECNTASLILIGAETGATLGSIWIASEWHRYRVLSYDKSAEFLNISKPVGVEVSSEGKNIAAALWLSPSGTLGTRSITLSRLLDTAVKKEKMPLGLLFGDGDSASKSVCESLKTSLQGSDKTNKLLATKAIEGAKTKGHTLLQKELDTEVSISKFVRSVLRERPVGECKKRDTENNGYVWEWRSAGGPANKQVEIKPNPKIFKAEKLIFSNYEDILKQPQ